MADWEHSSKFTIGSRRCLGGVSSWTGHLTSEFVAFCGEFLNLHFVGCPNYYIHVSRSDEKPHEHAGGQADVANSPPAQNKASCQGSKAYPKCTSGEKNISRHPEVVN